MKTIGKSKERPLSFHASGELLKEGALFNTELQKIESTLYFPRGVYHYKTHEEADRHWMDAVVATVVAVQEKRHGK